MTCNVGILECINETATGRIVNCDSSIQVIKSANFTVYTAKKKLCINSLHSTGHFLSLECSVLLSSMLKKTL